MARRSLQCVRLLQRRSFRVVAPPVSPGFWSMCSPSGAQRPQYKVASSLSWLLCWVVLQQSASSEQFLGDHRKEIFAKLCQHSTVCATELSDTHGYVCPSKVWISAVGSEGAETSILSQKLFLKSAIPKCPHYFLFTLIISQSLMSCSR